VPSTELSLRQTNLHIPIFLSITPLSAMRLFTSTSLRCPCLLPLQATRPIVHLSTIASQGRPKTSICQKHTYIPPALRLTTPIHHRGLSSYATRWIHKGRGNLTVQHALNPAIPFRPHNSKNSHFSSTATTSVAPPEAREEEEAGGEEEAGEEEEAGAPKSLDRQRQVSIALGRLLRSPKIPSAEVAILSMLNQYRFDFDHLKKSIEGLPSQPRFSNV
jgi:hypothetical protein